MTPSSHNRAEANSGSPSLSYLQITPSQLDMQDAAAGVSYDVATTCQEEARLDHATSAGKCCPANAPFSNLCLESCLLFLAPWLPLSLPLLCLNLQTNGAAPQSHEISQCLAPDIEGTLFLEQQDIS